MDQLGAEYCFTSCIKRMIALRSFFLPPPSFSPSPATHLSILISLCTFSSIPKCLILALLSILIATLCPVTMWVASLTLPNAPMPRFLPRRYWPTRILLVSVFIGEGRVCEGGAGRSSMYGEVSGVGWGATQRLGGGWGGVVMDEDSEGAGVSGAGRQYG